MNEPRQLKELPDVVWIGGGSGAGKTTIARTLANRLDLGFYRVDAHGYEHRDRLIAAGAIEETHGGQDERWLEPEPEELVRRFVDGSRRIFPLILDDLAALDREVGVIVEGPQLLPSSVQPHLATSDHGLWLLPSEGFQRRSLEARAGDSAKFTSDPRRALDRRLARNRLLDASTRDEATAKGLRVIEVDGSIDLPGMIERVSKHVAPALATMARFPDGAARSRSRRGENDAMVRNARAYLAELGAAAPPEGELPFACECATLGCDLLIQVTPSAYDRARTELRPITA